MIGSDSKKEMEEGEEGTHRQPCAFVIDTCRASQPPASRAHTHTHVPTEALSHPMHLSSAPPVNAHHAPGEQALSVSPPLTELQGKGHVCNYAGRASSC